jgi:hypothetical protein
MSHHHLDAEDFGKLLIEVKHSLLIAMKYLHSTTKVICDIK